MSKNFLNKDDSRELTLDEFDGIAGGVVHFGGPICPACNGTNVTFNAKLGIIYACGDCG